MLLRVLISESFALNFGTSSGRTVPVERCQLPRESRVCLSNNGGKLDFLRMEEIENEIDF